MSDSASIGVPFASKSIDAFVEDLIGNVPHSETNPKAIATVLPGEVKMATEFIRLALTTADMPFDCEERRDARAWLQDQSRLYSARLCFEALGKDFDVVRKLLVQRWLMQETK